MTTQPHPDESVPRYFYDFTRTFADYQVENERQHGQLAASIAAAENRLLLRILGIVTVVVGGSVGAATAYLVQRLG